MVQQVREQRAQQMQDQIDQENELAAAEAADNILAIILQHQANPLIDIYSDPAALATRISEFRKKLITDLLNQPASFKLLRNY